MVVLYGVSPQISGYINVTEATVRILLCIIQIHFLHVSKAASPFHLNSVHANTLSNKTP